MLLLKHLIENNELTIEKAEEMIRESIDPNLLDNKKNKIINDWLK